MGYLCSLQEVSSSPRTIAAHPVTAALLILFLCPIYVSRKSYATSLEAPRDTPPRPCRRFLVSFGMYLGCHSHPVTISKGHWRDLSVPSGKLRPYDFMATRNRLFRCSVLPNQWLNFFPHDSRRKSNTGGMD